MGRGGCGDTTARFPRGHFGGPFEAMDLSSESPLYLTLCAADEAGGTCTFPSEVKLTENLGCHSEECDIQTLKQVKITTATETVYYEYEPAPCVDLEFYNDGKTLKIDGEFVLVLPLTSDQCSFVDESVLVDANDECYAALIWEPTAEDFYGYGTPLMLNHEI